MDSFWQQHKSFVLQILAGLFVGIVCWIIGSSLNEESLGDRVAKLEKRDRMLSTQSAPADADLAALGAVVRRIDERIGRVARSVGPTADPEDPEEVTAFRREVLGRILTGIGYAKGPRKDYDDALDDLLRKAVSNPNTCVIGLKGEAKDYLLREAARRNIQIEPDLGFGRETVEASEIDRYLVALAVIVHVVNVALEEDVYELGSIQIRSPTEVEAEVFQGPVQDPDDAVIVRIGRRYPVGFTVRAPSATVLRFLERLIAPTPDGDGSGEVRFLAFRELGSLAPSSRTRREGEDLMQASFTVMALHIGVEADTGD